MPKFSPFLFMWGVCVCVWCMCSTCIVCGVCVLCHAHVVCVCGVLCICVCVVCHAYVCGVCMCGSCTLHSAVNQVLSLQLGAQTDLEAGAELGQYHMQINKC